MQESGKKRPLALVTGASSGIGLELARLHASRGGDLVLVARSRDKLAQLKGELEGRHGGRVTVMARDLSKPGAARQVFEAVRDAGLEVDYLVNNAGFGGAGAFHERPWEDDRAMIRLNILALTGLTRLFLPGFVRRGSGRVLNVSSTASLMPGPMQAVYFATKAYVTSFSNALAEELRGTGVTVTALLPGATDTGFARAADLENAPIFTKIKAAGAAGVARAGYEGMLKGRLNVLAGLSLGMRLQLALLPLAPKSMVLRLVRRLQQTGE